MPQAKTEVALQFLESCAAEVALQHSLFGSAEVIFTKSCAAASEKLQYNFEKAALQESGAFLPLSCGFQAPTFRHPRLGPDDIHEGAMFRALEFFRAANCAHTMGCNRAGLLHNGKRAERQKWGKSGKNMENLPRLKMGKKWPKNTEKMENWPDFPFFWYFSAIFSPFSIWADFPCFSRFFSHFVVRPVFHCVAAPHDRKPWGCFGLHQRILRELSDEVILKCLR